MPEEYYTSRNASTRSTFDDHCDFVLRYFNKKWRPHAKRQQYISAFSSESWSRLPAGEQGQHSLANCNACAKRYGELQLAFPGPPYYSAPSSTVVPLPQGCSPSSTVVQLPQGCSVQEATRKVLGELNHSYQEAYKQSFSHAIVQYCGKAEGIERRKKKSEKKQVVRKIQRKFRDSTNQQFASTAALSFLSSDDSMRKYQRKRLTQSFEHQPQLKRVKSHIPSASVSLWDSEAIVKDVREWPDGKKMNWSELARCHGVTGGNVGQIVKGIVEESGVDVSRFSERPTHRQARASKRKLPGQEVFIPANPTLAAIKADIQAMIADGKLVLGEPCAPYTLTLM